MSSPSLSTMWGVGRFASMADFAAAALHLGFTQIEANYMVSPRGLEELLAADGLSILSLHAPAPRVQGEDGLWSNDLNLASLDDEERRRAVLLARGTIEWAARVGARWVVLHLGQIGKEMAVADRELRRLYRRGHPTSFLGRTWGLRWGRLAAEMAPRREELQRWRRESAAPYLAQARRSLEELAGEAARRGVALGLENRYHYHEIPAVEEALDLLAPYPPEVVGYWHDVGHAEVLGRLGLIAKEEWLRALGPRTLGSHLHDVAGLVDHRPPGRGSVDWRYIAEGLPPGALRVLEINQETSPEDVVAAVPFLRERQVVP